MTDTPTPIPKGSARRALKVAGWANVALAAGHVVSLIWIWSVFRAVGIEGDMRLLAEEGAALPYIVTLVVAAGFGIFGLYALSGAGDLRRLPLLRTGLGTIAVIYLFRATWVPEAVREGDAAQVAFAAVALLIGLCYALGAVRPAPRKRSRGALGKA